MAAASQVFARQGYASTQIADIAAQLGIGHGTVYRYYKDKRDLFAAVIDRAAERVGAVLALDAPRARTLAEYRAQLVRIGVALYDLVASEPATAQLLLRHAMGADDVIANKIYDTLDLFARFAEAYLTHGQEQGFLRRDLDVRVAGLAINGIIIEGARTIMRAQDPVATKTAWIRNVPDLILCGIATPAAAES